MSIGRRHAINLVGTCVLVVLSPLDQVHLWIPFTVAVLVGNNVIKKRSVRPSRRVDAWFDWFVRSLFGSAAVVLFIADFFGWGWRVWFQVGTVACLAIAVIAYALWDYRTCRVSDNPADQPITSSVPE